EHPQIIALVLAHLDPDQAAEVIGHLPDRMRSDSRQLAMATPMGSVQVRTDDLPIEQQAPARLGSAAPAMEATLAYEKRVESARRMVSEDSKQVAQVVKNWVNEDAG
ncbi:MAG: hypothetical protein ABI379_06910, partial [Rhodanobacter sp.]